MPMTSQQRRAMRTLFVAKELRIPIKKQNDGNVASKMFTPKDASKQKQSQKTTIRKKLQYYQSKTHTNAAAVQMPSSDSVPKINH